MVELTIGVNGRIWIKGGYDDIRFLRSFILRCEKVAEEEFETIFKDMIANARGHPSTTVDANAQIKEEIKEEIEDDDPMDTTA